MFVESAEQLPVRRARYKNIHIEQLQANLAHLISGVAYTIYHLILKLFGIMLNFFHFQLRQLRS